jgi:hypothetical protein
MARLHKPKKKSELDKIRQEKVHVSSIIHRATVSSTCPKEKMDGFIARWHALCSEELRAIVEAAEARKAAAA